MGPWLTERQGEWDALVWAKVDRAFRSAKDCADVAHWAEENHKVLVFTDDGITLDYRRGRESSFGNELAKVFLMLASIFAEMELKRIKARVAGAHRHLRKTDRWAGGQPPYGYRIVDRPGGGRTLEPDPVTSEAVRYMGKLLLEGQSQWMIATALEAAGFDTPATHVFKHQGETYSSKRKTPPSNHWNASSVGKILRSPATMGLKLVGRSVKARKLARDAKGLPIRMAKPLFTDEEWVAIQAAMDERSVTRERANGAAPWLGVVHCDRCGDRLYRQENHARNGRGYEYYRCVRKTGKPACKGQSVKAERVAAAVAALVDGLAGVAMTVRRFAPGEDHTEQLNHVAQAMKDLREEKRRGLFDYPGGDDEYSEALETLVDERRRLAALPQRPAAWVDVVTGETVADALMTTQATLPAMRETLYDIAGKTIFVAETGDGPPLFLLHGGGPGASGVSNYTRNIAHLAQKYRVIVPDLPGYGRSSKGVDRTDPFGHLATHIRGLMDRLDLDKAHLVGNSYGGACALRLALDTPERVERMVLMGPGGVGATRALPTPGLNHLLNYYTGTGPSRRKLEKFIRNYLVFNAADVPDAVITARYEASIDPDVVAAPPLQRPSGPDALRIAWRMDFTRDKRLAHLPVPTLVVWGADDKVNRPSGGPMLADRMPNCDLYLVANTGHWVQYERADLFNRLCTDFLDGPR